jgi:hypothetical protein
VDTILLSWAFHCLNISQWSTAMPNSQEIEAKSHSPVPQGYVLGAEEGEHLIHFRDGGNIFIKVDPVTGSNNLGLGTAATQGLGHSGSPTPPQGRSLLRSGRHMS